MEPDRPDLDAVFRALAHPVRRAILSRLTHGRTATVTALAAPFEMSLAGISKHLHVLRSAGLVQVEAVGRERHVRPVPEALATVETWVVHHRRSSKGWPDGPATPEASVPEGPHTHPPQT